MYTAIAILAPVIAPRVVHPDWALHVRIEKGAAWVLEELAHLLYAGGQPTEEHDSQNGSDKDSTDFLEQVFHLFPD